VEIDVEGLTLPVLRGMRETLEARRPMLRIERPRDDSVERFLRPLGYRPFRYDPARREPLPFAREKVTNIHCRSGRVAWRPARRRPRFPPWPFPTLPPGKSASP
jgi:hypothetical protein